MNNAMEEIIEDLLQNLRPHLRPFMKLEIRIDEKGRAVCVVTQSDKITI